MTTSSSKQKIAALYARTSQDKDDAYSLSSQLAAMREYAQAQGLSVPPEFEFKEEFTGTKIDRPELHKVRTLMATHKIDTLVIYRADRLARMQHIAGYLLHEEIFANAIELHVVSFGGRIRPGTRDVLIFNIESAISQDERDTIVERTQRGKRNKLMGGDGVAPAWIGYGPIDPYGYQKHGKLRNTHYTIVEDEAEVIRQMFVMFAEGRRGREIIRELEAAGVPPPSVKKGYKRMVSPSGKWCDSMVYKILKNTMYIGVWYANKHMSVNGKKVFRPKEEWIRLDFPELQIIDDATFTQVQELLAQGRKLKAPGPTHDYLMARRMRCVCNYSVMATTTIGTGSKKPLSYYYCWNRLHHGKEHCNIPYIRADFLDAKVWECIEQLLRYPEAQLQGLKDIQEQQRNKHQDVLERMNKAQQTIEECNRKLGVYSDQEAEGLISRQMLRTRKAELDERSAAAQAVYNEYAQKLGAKVLTDEEIRDTVTLLTMLNERLADAGELDFATRRSLIEALHITGKWDLEETDEGCALVLNLKIHTQHLAKILEAVKQSGSRYSSCSSFGW